MLGRGAMPERRYHIMLNPHSGTAQALGLDAETLSARFAAHGLDAAVDADADTPFPDRIARALGSDADTVVAAGGDGTVTALAAALVGTDKTLAILPLGTANLLARDLLIPLEVDEAIAALAAMAPRRIDVGEVNGRVFLHKVVIGLMPGIAAGREQIRDRDDFGARFGFVLYFFRRLARARRIAVEIAPAEGPPRIARVQALAVANNAYDEGLGRFFARQRLDAGTLSLYVVRHFDLRDLLRLSLGMVMGNWRHDEALIIESTPAVTIRSRRKRLKTMFDGEVETLEVPLDFTIRPGALSVLAPVPPEPPDEGS